MITQAGQLLVQQQGAVIQTISLNMPVLRIGRAPEGELVLENQSVSRNHAEIRVGTPGLALTDLGSSNGTFIGEQRLLPHQPHLLSDGARFRIGPYLLIYRASPDVLLGADESIVPVSPPEVPASIPQSVMSTKQLVPSSQATALAHKPVEAGMLSLYASYLPDIYQENDFLQRYLHIFENIWEPLEQRQDHIEMYFDPRTCPRSFLSWLASWLDASLKSYWPEERQRRFLAQAMELYSWRGTSYGLTRIIEVCTGLTPEITEEAHQPFVFRIRLILPPEGAGTRIDRAFIEELIQMHKPAYAGYILDFGN